MTNHTKEELEAAKKHGQNVFVPTELVVDDRVTEQLATNSFLAGITYQKDKSYPKEDLIGFAKWVRNNTVADGAPKLYLKGYEKIDINKSRYSIEELLEIFLRNLS